MAMTMSDQLKVIKAGFVLIRADEYPTIRIKIKDGKSMEWRTLEKFETKAARDRKMRDLLKSDMIITD
jgi:hypothetical protein